MGTEGLATGALSVPGTVWAPTPVNRKQWMLRPFLSFGQGLAAQVQNFCSL